MYRLVQLLILVSFTREIIPAKILAIFPTPSFSHQVVFHPLYQELARRGHQVTVLTTDPIYKNGNTPENLTEIDVHDISYEMWRKGFVNNLEFGIRTNILKHIPNAAMIIGQVVEAQIKTKAMQRLINDPNTKFDLLLIEGWPQPALIFTHIFKAPVIAISSFGMVFYNDHMVGAPAHPFLYPFYCHQRLYNLTIWEKLNELYNRYTIGSRWDSFAEGELRTFRKLVGNDLPDYSELRKNVDMLFLNMHEMWIDNQPLPPNVVSIWGIYKKPIKPLPQDLQNYLDSSKNGVIYLSFGTNAPSSMLPKEFIQLLIRVFSKLPYDVLWKWEKDNLPGISSNIKIQKWLPQSDLLRHPNVKLFITQGGIQSTEEAINSGVPLIGFPMLADQWYNVEKYPHHGIGVKLDIETVTDEELETSIKTIIKNSRSYKENVLRLQKLMSDQPESALSRAVWWTEYVLRHGSAKHLRSPAANMPAAQYYEIPLVLTLVAIALLIVLTLILAAYFIYQSLSVRIKIKVA